MCLRKYIEKGLSKEQILEKRLSLGVKDASLAIEEVGEIFVIMGLSVRQPIMVRSSSIA